MSVATLGTNNHETGKIVLFPPNVTISNNPPLIVNDERSQQGQFGWGMLAREHLPYIFRGNDRFFNVRMVEARVIAKYKKFLHQDIFTKCLSISSFYISFFEARLLNEINHFHCNSAFGTDQFSSLDLIISATDAEKLCEFLECCLRRLTEKDYVQKCGFVKINNESLVPFIVSNTVKYVPLFYFEGETHKLKDKSIKLTGWDLCYIKFLCRVQNVQNNLFAFSTCSVIDVREIMCHFPPNTSFVEAWTENAQQLIVEDVRNSNIDGNWIRKPTTPPLFSVAVVPKENPKVYRKTENIQRNLSPKYVSKSTSNKSTAPPTSAPLPTFPPSHPVRFLIPITEAIGKNMYFAYKFQWVVIDGKNLPCINMNPFYYHEILMVCIIDVNEYLFKNVPFHICSSVIQALKIPLYKANSQQVNVFISNNRFRYCNSILPLILVKDIIQYLPQMKYMLASSVDLKTDTGTNSNNTKIIFDVKMT